MLLWYCSEIALKLFRNCSEIVQKLFRNCSEIVQKSLGNRLETWPNSTWNLILKLLQYCSEIALESLWSGREVSFDMTWNLILKLFRNCPGMALYSKCDFEIALNLLWNCSRSVLILHWNRTDSPVKCYRKLFIVNANCCSGTALTLLQKCSEIALESHWIHCETPSNVDCTLRKLASWNRSESALEVLWNCSESANGFQARISGWNLANARQTQQQQSQVNNSCHGFISTSVAMLITTIMLMSLHYISLYLHHFSTIVQNTIAHRCHYFSWPLAKGYFPICYCDYHKLFQWLEFITSLC